jgi:hypothetical protein
MLSSLAREAAELLWEMVATEDIGDAMQQMRENATTIQVRLRRGPRLSDSAMHAMLFLHCLPCLSSDLAVQHPGRTELHWRPGHAKPVRSQYLTPHNFGRSHHPNPFCPVCYSHHLRCGAGFRCQRRSHRSRTKRRRR